MNGIYFQGFWRMDWGLGNPNKTAALIAMLMVFVWALAAIRRGGFWAALTLFTGLGICLVHTYSRGGIIAAAVGIGILIVTARRPWPKSRIAALSASVWCIIGFSILIQAHQRYSQGIAMEDRSISNRLAIWKTAPRMMVDAPAGWGVGNSGRAYVQWYQPLDRTETYRTLVNSHLTWLVEFGWPGRFFYLLFWSSMAAWCWPCRRTVANGVPLAVWSCFFVAAAFSSVAESPWLWIVPAAAAVQAGVCRWISGSRFSLLNLGLPSAAALAGCLILYLTGAATESGVARSGEVVTFGPGQPRGHVVTDPSVLGKNAGRVFREYAGRHAFPSMGFSESLRDLPHGGIPLLVLGGVSSSVDPADIRAACARARRVIIVNPKIVPQMIGLAERAAGTLTVCFGEFAQSPGREEWSRAATVRLLPGIGDYIPDWPATLLSYESTLP